MTDIDAVAAAVDGCDAVVHTANIYSYDPRLGRNMAKTNVDGTQTITSISTTLDTYGHLMEGLDARVADRLDERAVATLGGGLVVEA